MMNNPGTEGKVSLSNILVFIILVTLMLAFLTGCGSSTPSPMSTSLIPSATPVLPTTPPTLTPTPTETATPSPTPGFRSNSVLTDAQRKELYEISQDYLADTEAKAQEISDQLHFVNNDGHPSLMCGPLAAEILRRANIINPYTDIHEFWLLRPTYNTVTIRETFPEDRFKHYFFEQNISEFDYTVFPLQEGDFVYLYAGDAGTFEHMFTVTRVDDAGRAYSVTNINTPEGYLIKELMLYDPTRPGVGQMYDWTNRTLNRKLGLTGFGGFDVFRPIVPIAEPSSQETGLTARLDKIMEGAPAEWRVLIKEVNGPVIYERLPLRPGHFASIIKIPVGILFFKSLEKLNIAPEGYADFLKNTGDGRSYEQLLEAMLVHSEEDATERLLSAIQLNTLNVPRTFESWGVAEDINLKDRIISARDLASLMEGLYNGTLLPAPANEIMLGHMEAYTSGDDTRLGTLRKGLPEGSHFYNKRGTITEERLVVGDAAIIALPTGKAYIAIVVGTPGDAKVTYEELNDAIGEMGLALGEYLSNP